MIFRKTHLKSHKAASPDKLASAVFKELSTVIAPVLQKIFTKSLDTYTVSNDWKKAQITPTFKKGIRIYQITTGQSSALTCICSKILEHIVEHIITSDMICH